MIKAAPRIRASLNFACLTRVVFVHVVYCVMSVRVSVLIRLLSATALIHPAFAADARTLQIFVSKDKQSLAVYDGAEVVATSKISSGKDWAHDAERHLLRHREAAEVPQIQHLFERADALHAAADIIPASRCTKSSSVPRYPASHGCVRMPGAFAEISALQDDRDGRTLSSLPTVS